MSSSVPPRVPVYFLTPNERLQTTAHSLPGTDRSRLVPRFPPNHHSAANSKPTTPIFPATIEPWFARLSLVEISKGVRIRQNSQTWIHQGFGCTTWASLVINTDLSSPSVIISTSSKTIEYQPTFGSAIMRVSASQTERAERETDGVWTRPQGP